MMFTRISIALRVLIFARLAPLHAQDQNNLGQNILDGPETLVRFGVATKTELRLTVPDYYYNLTSGGPGSGVGDLAVGAKQQLGPTPHGFEVSATLFLSFPTGAATVSSGGYDPGLQVAWSDPLSTNWTLAGMFSLYEPTQGHSRNLTGIHDLFGSATNPALGCFCRVRG
jgi:hypothetical protein